MRSVAMKSLDTAESYPQCHAYGLSGIRDLLRRMTVDRRPLPEIVIRQRSIHPARDFAIALGVAAVP